MFIVNQLLVIFNAQTYNHKMISSVVFVNIKGQILIYRTYKDDVTRASIQNYSNQIIASKLYLNNPIVFIDGVSFIAVPDKQIILVATTTTNLNALMAIQFLYKLISICKAYCNGEFSESKINKNFSLIYQILDQVMDYGCPQQTNPVILNQYIQEGKFNDFFTGRRLMGCSSCQSNSLISWRPQGIYYKKNEIFLEIVQDIKLLFSANGKVLSSNVSGALRIISHLSGFPQCALGMNDSLLSLDYQQITTRDNFVKGISLDEMKFHKCVKFPKTKQRQIIFTPPDGNFQLMSYKTTQNITVPFKIFPFYTQLALNRLEIRIRLKSLFDKNLSAHDVICKISVPKQTTSVTYYRLTGKAHLELQNELIKWQIQKFQGKTECELLCQDKTSKEYPIRLQFQIPMFTASNLKLNYLKVYEKAGYKVAKSYKSLTKSGSYEYRL